MARAEKSMGKVDRCRAMDSDGTTRAKHTDAEKSMVKTGKMIYIHGVDFPNIPWLVYFC